MDKSCAIGSQFAFSAMCTTRLVLGFAWGNSPVAVLCGIIYCSCDHKFIHERCDSALALSSAHRALLIAHDVAASAPTVSEPAAPAVPSRSALRLLFSMTSSFLCANIFICRSSTPFNQYPNEPPMLANNGYTHNAPLWKNGLISMPICTMRVAMPAVR